MIEKKSNKPVNQMVFNRLDDHCCVDKRSNHFNVKVQHNDISYGFFLKQ